jgi:HAD superfamily hydrolase (TIGR01509 family)
METDMSEKMLQALLFDVDGTLADTEEAHRLAFNEAFTAAGLDWEWSPALYTDLLKVTGGKERIRHYVETCHPQMPAIDDLIAFAASLHQDKTARYVKRMESGQIPLRPGVRRILEEAREAGLRLAIATTTSLPNVQALLDNSLFPGAMDWFEVIGAGDMVATKKPAPDVYDYVMHKLGLTPADCLALEDSRNGVRSAKAANLPVLVTLSDYTRDDDVAGADLVLDTFGEPDLAFTVVEGESPLPEARWVTVDFMRALHAQATA